MQIGSTTIAGTSAIVVGGVAANSSAFTFVATAGVAGSGGLPGGIGPGASFVDSTGSFTSYGGAGGGGPRGTVGGNGVMDGPGGNGGEGTICPIDGVRYAGGGGSAGSGIGANAPSAANAGGGQQSYTLSASPSAKPGLVLVQEVLGAGEYWDMDRALSDTC